jgi:protein SCO1
MKRLALAAILLACTGALAAGYFLRHGGSHAGHAHKLSALRQTMIAVEPGKPLDLPRLVATDGAPFGAERLAGRWTLVFFGFTSCPDVCPTTLQLMSEVARDPASGAAGGAMQVVFVTVDPQRDSPARLKGYLAHFDPRFIGLSGGEPELERFAQALGAGAARSPSGSIDHSTSLFAVDPLGRLAGVLLRPADPARIVADLGTLRAAFAADANAANRR